MTEPVLLTATIPEHLSGERLDKIAAELFPDFSRSVIQGWIKNGSLLADGETCKPRDKRYVGTTLTIEAELEAHTDWLAEDIPLEIIFEDDALLIVNKPAGLVVHPAPGNYTGTLVNALLHYLPESSHLPRAGIVHRLDKDTTGLMVVAKTLPAHHQLIQQLQERTVKRVYQAVVYGDMTGGGTIDEPIGRHPQQRTRMAVEPLHGKPSITHYRVSRRFSGFTHIEATLETGRTHQIRVHMSHIRHPLVGDAVYGGRNRIPAGKSEIFRQQLLAFPRQALHAGKLGLCHPGSGEYLEWQTELPGDISELLKLLERECPV